MSFKDTFCPTPWFHARIYNTGQYTWCRWLSPERPEPTDLGVGDINIIQFFQKNMAEIRMGQLSGQPKEACKNCYEMEKHGKVSGRQKQLLKIGVQTDNFEKTFLSSPWLSVIKDSVRTNGELDLMPQDWQIDLGNFCNSACIMCSPVFSSKLAAEHKKLKLITELPKSSWCDTEEHLNEFVALLAASPNLRYLHFLGGETVIIPAFKKMLQALVDKDMAKNVSIGFTTGLRVWDEPLIALLKEFKEINLGLSIECLHPVNDYVRYPSNINDVTECLHKWVALGKENNWLIQLRSTPTLFTINQLTTLYEYAYSNNIGIESCNFMNDPAFMSSSVLPMEYRKKAITKIKEWLATKEDVSKELVVNNRSPSNTLTYVIQDAKSYVEYLENAKDDSNMLPELVKYLKLMESSRGNSVLTYLPEYENLLRAAGY